tara:strand:+ start:94 stop:555 length:462 start_codon:yes stop_codon:yes gene_type:complete
MNIGDIATEIYHSEFDSTGVSSTAISGWFANNVGMLNTYLYTNFSGDNGVISGMGLEEADIYKEMYLYHYYTKQARNTLRGIATDSNGNILSVRDGDNSITFVNKNEVTKVYKGLANDSYEKMIRMAQSYSSYNASPRQVGGTESNISLTGAF